MPSNFIRQSQRKKQTRLAFEPIEPSSSATMSPARVRYETHSPPSKAFDLTSSGLVADDTEDDSFPSGKKYAVVVETPKKHKNDSRTFFKPLATPAESSQQEMANGDPAEHSDKDYSDSEIEIIPRHRRQVRRLRTSSSPRKSSPFQSSSSDIQRLQTGTHIFFPSTRERRGLAYDGLEDDSSAGSSPEEEKQAVNYKAKTKPKKRSGTSKSITLSGNDSGAESPLESPSRVRVTRGRAVIPENYMSEDMDEPKSADTRSLISGGALNFSQKSKKISRKGDVKHKDSTFNSPSRSSGKASKDNSSQPDEDTIVVRPVPKRKGRKGTYKQQIVITDDLEDPDAILESSQRRSGKFSKLTDEDSSENEFPSLSQISRLASPKWKGARTFENNNDDEEEEEDSIIEHPSAKRLRKQVIMHRGENGTDEDDEDPVSSPLKRRRLAVEEESESDPVTSPPKRLRSKPIEQKDTESNLEAPSKRITRQQQRKKPHRSEREKKLELLKRQRAGEKITELPSSESEAEKSRPGIYDSDSELEVLSEFEDEEKDDDEGIEQVRRSLIASNQNDDDDFIVDDDDVPLGVPEHSLNDIPLEFTHHAHKPLKEHFKDAVEWMIQKKVNPAFNRKDPVYLQAFKKLDTEVQGYATSIYSSSVWKKSFTRALWARPVFMESAITPSDEHEGTKCDACGRTNHPATFELQFSGKAYYKDTLDEVDNDHGDDEDEDDEDNSSTVSVNSKGQEIPGTEVSWYVGRFCRANAQTAHSLIHWKHALNEWVIDRLKTEGLLAAPKLAEREDWSTSKRSKYANRIVDEWEQAGEIKALYRDFKINLDFARQGKPTRWSK